MDLMANSLLAFGASPAMVHAKEEVDDFAQIADVLVINVGTLTPSWIESMKRAIHAVVNLGKPWVLDPVGCGATSYRTQQCRELLALQPTLIRGNASEIIALADASEERTRGVDSTIDGDASLLLVARKAARILAEKCNCVIAISGAEDFITDGNAETYISVNNGVPMLQAITATGCSVTAICAACIAATLKEEMTLSDTFNKDPKKAVSMATASGLALFGHAAEVAVLQGATGPGTLRSVLLDALYSMQESEASDGASELSTNELQSEKRTNIGLKMCWRAW